MFDFAADIANAIESGDLHPDDGKALTKLGEALSLTEDHPRGDLAQHCASLLLSVARVVKYSPPNEIDMDQFHPRELHLCPTYLDAAILLLAHGFEQNDNGSSPVIDFADAIIRKLIEQD